MTTAEMERRLVVALRSADSVPVDVATARDRWMQGEMDRRQTTRRRLVAAVAAAAVVAGLTVALVARLVDPGPQLPPAREITLSASGLPVGELHGKVMLANEGGLGQKVVVIVVRPDGTASYGRNDLAETWDEFDLTVRPDGQGRAVFGYSGPVCNDPNALTLGFRADARTVTIEEAIPGPGGCVVSADDAVALRGVTFRVRPLPDAR